MSNPKPKWTAPVRWSTWEELCARDPWATEDGFARLKVSKDVYVRAQKLWNEFLEVPDPISELARLREVENQLRSILEIGKRDLTNPKYDTYFSMDNLNAQKVLKGEG